MSFCSVVSYVVLPAVLSSEKSVSVDVAPQNVSKSRLTGSCSGSGHRSLLLLINMCFMAWSEHVIGFG